MNLKLENKLSLVTGSTARIGCAIAEALGVEGAKVIINGRTQEAVNRTISTLQPKVVGEIVGLAGDLSTVHAAVELAQQYLDVEVLINNLGIFEMVEFVNITDDYW